MKKILFTLALFAQVIVYGQYDTQNSQDSLYKPLIPTERQELLKNIDVIFNTRIGFDNQINEGKYNNSEFDVNQFRLEIKGKIHEKVYFRFRDRYTRSADPGSRDNVSRTTDMAFIGIDVTPKTQITFGKMSADWGGFEFDMNPIDILEYNDIIENADNFLTGAGISHQLTEKHKLNFQVLNSRTRNFSDIYEGKIPPGIKESKAPLALVGNWRGTFFDGKFETTYSFSHFTEARNKAMNYIALGNKYHNKNFTLMYDFQYSNEALDRKLIASNIIDGAYPYAAEDVVYLENWIRMEYLITPKINLSLTLMTNNTYWKGNPDPNASDRLVTSYGFIPSVQYIPFKDLNLRFYVSYVGRSYDYSNYAENVLGQSDYNTGRLSVGFIAPLLIL